MEQVEVPIVRRETDLRQAIATLKEYDKSGLIVDLPEGPRVLFVDELLRVLRDKDGGNVIIEKVLPRYRAVRLPPTGTTNLPEAIRRGREATVSSSGAQFAVLEIREGHAQVVATSEPPARRFTSCPPLYRCQTNHDHVWQREELKKEDECNLDSSRVERY